MAFQFNPFTGNFDIAGSSTGASTFTGLTDTPDSYTGQSGKAVVVKATEDGVEFVTAGGTGDMTKAVYDTDNDGRVDKAESVDDGTNVSTAAQVKTAVDNSHTHSNSAVLAATTASFLIADETKLDGIAAGAEVNVNADWNSVSGDSQILNKPTLGDSASKNVGTSAGTVAAGDHNHTGVYAPVLGSDDNYVTDAEKVKLSNLSGTNTGDQTITLTGEATGTGTGSFAVTITNSAVIGKVLTGLSLATSQVIAATDTVLQAFGYIQAQITALTTVVSGKVASTRSISTTAPLSGGGDLSADRTLTTSMSTGKLIGRGTAGTGVMEEITLGTNLSLTGTTLNAAGGGSGTPGGSDTQVQFNDGGAFGGDADFTWDKTNNDLVLGGTDTGITLNGITNEPAAPSAGRGHLYAKSISGKIVPKWKSPSGLDYPLQASLWQNNITMWNPTTATAGVWLGTAGAGAGTYTTALPTTTSLYTSIKRGRWANVVTTANQVLGQRNTELMYMSSPSTAGMGGFFFYARCGFDVWTNGGRFFAGMATATTVISANPSALNNTVGFCVDSGDNGAISFLTRGTASTKASTGLTITTGKGYDLYIFNAPGTSTYSWRIVDINTGTEASGTATLTPPAANTMQTANVLASNAALTTVTSIQLGINKIYVETDY